MNTEVLGSTAEDFTYMEEALKLAQCSFDIGDTPIGAVIVYEGRIIGRGMNRRNADKNSLRHAEIEAIDQACRFIGDWRLEKTTLYVTLEPCPMCAGAIVQSRIPKVVIGAMNPKAGCAGSIFNLLQEERLNHQCQIVSGVMKEESRALLQQFFGNLRKSKKESTEENHGEG